MVQLGDGAFQIGALRQITIAITVKCKLDCLFVLQLAVWQDSFCLVHVEQLCSTVSQIIYARVCHNRLWFLLLWLDCTLLLLVLLPISFLGSFSFVSFGFLFAGVFR